ncbi:WAP, Kazal, immunoglobulin, Kunitz and NTR domain-containing protein [Pygocentrus nattereri]|uniref:WAP, follistatin/kazal, immunoglobulin, kunitz and netrin domain containing 1 n=1 Tax=Pygocentrus nattereri TaxID=42514 RepID=A0A3B4DMK3_PYGNA|nr:WAP, Kazal, immunoglobulin, Kunitz and NTR domain-containing protein [Pygocentrus nattereri]
MMMTMMLLLPPGGLALWLLFSGAARAAHVPHDGVCPNELNANLWVDAQSTCERECERDQDCADFEKCCTNVCGLLSCVAARFSDGSPALPDGQSGTNVSEGSVASCVGYLCNQQGAVCEVWEGQPVCKCQDRCESEPSFTCASDGLTYFNRCYMDAEACIQGVTLTVVTCRYHLSAPATSPLTLGTTSQATPTSSAPFPPTLYSNPQHQAVYLGGTVSFHCDVIGHPKPDVTWEKQSERREHLVMRPDQMYGNVVITNIGQLVVYNAQVSDTGIYTCVARNSVGVLHADYPLSVVIRAEHDFYEDLEAGMESLGRPFSPADCLAEVERGDCGETHVDWHYDTLLGSCRPFAHGGCPGGRNRFETYEECQTACQREGLGTCTLPAVQGPCRNWEARWAYNGISKQCQAFVYGGCQGNSNNFHSRAECEARCPQPKAHQCRSCRPKGRLVPSLCRSDFAIVGRLTELIEELDSGIARFSLEQVLRDQKMGLELFKARHLEVTLTHMDWNCPCPNVTLQEEAPLLVMGEVQDGMAVVLPHSYVRPVTDRRVRKIQEVLAKKTCEMLQRFQD